MPTYPDFDAEWVAKDAAARACESILQTFIGGLNYPSAAAIETAPKEQKQKCLDCQMLSERINAELQAREEGAHRAASAGHGSRETQGGEEHAVTEAKEYRAQIKILERM
jgi:hypothetical protein